MLTEEVAEYRRLLEDFHGQIANYDATGARVTEIWVRELNDPAFPRHLLAEHTVKVSRTASSLAILAVDRSSEKPPSEAREQLDSTQAALASVISRIQDTLRKTEYVLADRGLEGIVGEFLVSSVEFVMDYIQLRFCGATLTAFTCPDIQTPNRFFLPSSYGYRDALCSLISATVRKTLKSRKAPSCESLSPTTAQSLSSLTRARKTSDKAQTSESRQTACGPGKQVEPLVSTELQGRRLYALPFRCHTAASNVCRHS